MVDRLKGTHADGAAIIQRSLSRSLSFVASETEAAVKRPVQSPLAHRQTVNDKIYTSFHVSTELLPPCSLSFRSC